MIFAGIQVAAHAVRLAFKQIQMDEVRLFKARFVEVESRLCARIRGADFPFLVAVNPPVQRMGKQFLDEYDVMQLRVMVVRVPAQINHCISAAADFPFDSAG